MALLELRRDDNVLRKLDSLDYLMGFLEKKNIRRFKEFLAKVHFV